MKDKILEYLNKDYENLNVLIKEINEDLYESPHSAILKGRIFSEQLAKEIAKKENVEFSSVMGQLDRIRKLSYEGIIDSEIETLFNNIRIKGNKAAHEAIEEDLELALNIHRNVYKLVCWFIETYIDYQFISPPYTTPKYLKDKDANTSVLSKLLNKLDILTKNNKKEVVADSSNIIEDIEKKSNFIEEVDKECLIQTLSKLKESSKEAVENLNTFSDFKKYMHVPRKAQQELENLIFKAEACESSQLILVCGSVGDGKSHIISYFRDKYPEVINNFKLHNDATESLEPTETSVDTLNKVLDNFSDENINKSNEKFILAINLGTLNNFIDSKYGKRFTKLSKYVQEKKILETTIESNTFDENNNFQFVNFSDYHVYTLKEGKVHSRYIKSLINKVTCDSEINVFYNSYKKNCASCKNNDICPVKCNYELLSKEEVQDSIVDLLVQCIIKNKIIISTRALLNFLHEILISRSYIDINSPMFKENIKRLHVSEYIKALMPNIIFDHKELSNIFEALNTLDPLNVRNSKVDDFIIEFCNSTNAMEYFNQYIDYPKGYILKLEENNTKIEELLQLFIRSYYICGKGQFISLKDEVYEKFINYVYLWNKGDKNIRKTLYNEVREGIIKWNGDAENDYINIFIGQSQIKYKISEELKLKIDISNLPVSVENDISKFLTTLELKYSTEGKDESYKIDLDFALFNLLTKIRNGYRPNNKDKNCFIKFIEFISKIEDIGSQDNKLIFTEKNREENKKYKLEYNDEYEEYRFVEI